MTAKEWLAKSGDWYEPVTETGCWLWRRSTNGVGYGKLQQDGRLKYAHRLSYELLRGPIPEGFTIDHLCRIRCCVNPDHLEPVTMRENVLRGEGMSAKHAKKTHCPAGHPYSGTNLVIGVRGNRLCRICQNYHKRKKPTWRVK